MAKDDNKPAIVGRKACGHVVAVDVDDTPEHRLAFNRKGYAIEIQPRNVAITMLRESEHPETCLKGGGNG